MVGAKAGDVIWYHKTEKDFSINPQDLSICKYKEMLISTVKDALEVLDYGSPEKRNQRLLGYHDSKNTGESKEKGVGPRSLRR